MKSMGLRNREAGPSGIYGANISHFQKKRKKENRLTSKSLPPDTHSVPTKAAQASTLNDALKRKHVEIIRTQYLPLQMVN